MTDWITRDPLPHLEIGSSLDQREELPEETRLISHGDSFHLYLLVNGIVFTNLSQERLDRPQLPASQATLQPPA